MADSKPFTIISNNCQVVMFVTRDYGLKSQAIFKQFLGKEKIDNDTDNFRKYINLYDLISGKFNKR